jgi:hypothetical protein
MAEDGAATAGTAVQLIDGEGGFATDSAERFMAAAGVAECGLSYAVVSIFGPQGSGEYYPPTPSPRGVPSQRFCFAAVGTIKSG